MNTYTIKAIICTTAVLVMPVYWYATDKSNQKVDENVVAVIDIPKK